MRFPGERVGLYGNTPAVIGSLHTLAMSLSAMAGLAGIRSPSRQEPDMTVTSHAAPTLAPSPKRTTANKVGIGISAVIAAFLVFDAIGKFMLPDAVREGTVALGFPVLRHW